LFFFSVITQNPLGTLEGYNRPVKNHPRTSFLALIVALLLLQTACNSAPSPIWTATPSPTFPQQTTLTPSAKPNDLITTASPTVSTPVQTLLFAVIGDYGEGNDAEKDVADLVMSWRPDLIITTGDNNYPNGAADTIDLTIGQYFHSFIYPYIGIFGQGAPDNQFFPSLGNHDWVTDQAQPYLDYFSLPGNERYYQFQRGPVTFFVLDSDAHEPDGVNQSSLQADWLKGQLALSTTPWNIVYFHHPPYSSGYHGSTTWMRWPFKDWGADLVLSGHDHTYERLQINGLTYIVNGLGGGSIYDFLLPLAGSQLRYNQDYGAMRVEADRETLRIQFIDRSGQVNDDAILSSTP
jgi:tartrate-resistant acid phosphatase type 5